MGADPDTMLFEGANLEREFVLTGELDKVDPTWKLDYTFREKRIMKAGDVEHVPELIGGWNYAYRGLPPEKAGWSELRTNDGKKLYPTSNFNLLFVQGVGGPMLPGRT